MTTQPYGEAATSFLLTTGWIPIRMLAAAACTNLRSDHERNDTCTLPTPHAHARLGAPPTPHTLSHPWCHEPEMNRRDVLNGGIFSTIENLVCILDPGSGGVKDTRRDLVVFCVLDERTRTCLRACPPLPFLLVAYLFLHWLWAATAAVPNPVRFGLVHAMRCMMRDTLTLARLR